MRWLKFRVWYKRYPQPKEGEMRYFRQSEDDFPNSCYKYQTDKWMQFIGLQDSKGKDVYDSDIVLVTPFAGMDKNSYYGLVEWSGCGFQIKAPKEKSPFSNGYIPVAHSMGLLCGIEVVGNIYENKGILNEKASLENECKNCGGQGVSPNDPGNGDLLCEICLGSGIV